MLSPTIKEIQQSVSSQNLKLIVEGTILCVSDGNRQTVRLEFREESNDTKNAEDDDVIVID